jgi:hypothetical protein
MAADRVSTRGVVGLIVLVAAAVRLVASRGDLWLDEI